MKKKTGLAFSVISFAALVVVCILCGQLIVSAQGWRAGEPKTNVGSQPGDAKKSAALTNSASRTHKAKSGKAAKTNANAARAGEPKAKPSSAKASTPEKTTPETKEMKASRDRLVNHNKTADTNASSGGAPAKKWSVKGEKVTGDTRVAVATRARSGRCNPDEDERIDLSGAYNGDVNYPNGRLSGDATLTITGNRFTLRTGSKTESGNITAVTTCSYTAVAMMFGEWRTPQPGERAAPPLPMLSLTATRKGDQLTLKSSPSERREFSFAPAAKK